MREAVRRQQQRVEILVVEDNPVDLHLIREGLERATVPFRVQTASDGEQALRYLLGRDSPGHPHLILLDWALPRVSGTDVLRAIKQDERLREIPVVVLTSSLAADDVITAYDLHANCYLRKPLHPDQFLDVIAALERFWLQTATLPPVH